MLLSPGIESKETSLQTTVVNSATGTAALVGKFSWGPAFQINQVISEVDLVDRFGLPDHDTADSFFSGSNFLKYGNDLRLVRVVDENNAKNSSALNDALVCTITNGGTNYNTDDTVQIKYEGTDISGAVGHIIEVGEAGVITKVSIPSSHVIEHAKANGEYPTLSSKYTIDINSNGGGTGGQLSELKLLVDGGIYFPNDDLSDEAFFAISSGGTKSFKDVCASLRLPTVAARFPGESGDDLMVDIVSSKFYHEGKGQSDLPIYPYGGSTGKIDYRKAIQFGPSTDPNHFLMVVYKGGEMVESVVLSLKEGDKDIYGNNIFVNDYFASGRSRFISAANAYWEQDFHGRLVLGGGTSGNSTASAGEWQKGWDLFADRQVIQVNLLIAGACAGESQELSSQVQKYVAELADTRKDTLAFISPPRSAVVNLPSSTAIDNLIEWRTGQDANGQAVEANMNINSSYSAIDGNYKYQYDKYNDINRWVPLSADMAGLCVRTDQVSNPWMSPAGFNRGQIQGVIKLAVDTRQVQRDRLYQDTINPVVSFAGQGVILYGDKTAATEPTPFDRINVRRLFNMLKTNISNTAQYKLFELNDGFTQMSFRSEVNNYLDGIKSLGGMYDFRVVCDGTNNTPAVIDRNEFVATVLIKPARSINYIYLNFVATSTDADFDEIVG